MATWFTRTTNITRREWVVPFYGNCCDHTQLLQAIHAARTDRAALTGKSIHDLSDDAVMVSSDGDEIVVWFETHESRNT